MTLSIWGIVISNSGLDIYPYREYDENKKFVKYSSEYGAFVFTAFICGFFTFFSGSIFFYQVYLVCTNQSQWENVKAESLDFIKCYPSGFSPFDMGVWKNVRTIFFHGNKAT